MAHTALDIRPRSRDNKLKNREDSEGPKPMRNVSGQLRHVCQLASVLLKLVVDAVYYLGLCLRPSPALAAENLFLRKQLVLYQERQVKPRQATNATRIALVWLGQWFEWRRALGIVTPKTFIGWHRQGFRLELRCRCHSRCLGTGSQRVNAWWLDRS